MGTNKLSVKPDKMLFRSGEVAILLVASCYGNRDELRKDRVNFDFLLLEFYPSPKLTKIAISKKFQVLWSSTHWFYSVI